MNKLEEKLLAKAIFIQGNVPSSKNSKDIGYFFLKPGGTSSIYVKKGENDYRPVRLNLNYSKTAKKYVKNTEWDYPAGKKPFRELLTGKSKPYKIVFKFVRDTKRKFDYINAAQIVQDLMVKNGWLEEDNCSEMKPYFIDYEVDKHNAGVYISVL